MMALEDVEGGAWLKLVVDRIDDVAHGCNVIAPIVRSNRGL
jgi:hypothetical protein